MFVGGHARHRHQTVFETPPARILGVGPCRLPSLDALHSMTGGCLRRRHPPLCRGIHERNRANPVQNRRRAVAGYGQIAAAVPGGRQPGDGAAGKRPPRRAQA